MGKTPVLLMFFRDLIVRGYYHQWLHYLLMGFYSVAEFISEWYGLWFPIYIIATR